VPFGRDYRLRLVERPGLTLEDAALGRLVADLQGVADRCVPDGPLRYGVLSGERERLADALLAVAYRRDSGEAVGFSAMVGLEIDLDGRRTRVVHAGLAMVDRSLRSCGLCVALTAAPGVLAFLRNRFAPLWFTNVTQVPAVAGVFTKALADVFPTPDHRVAPSAKHAALVGEVMRRHRAAFGVGEEADFDERSFVIRNAYTGGSDSLKKSFAQCAKHRDQRFNAWFGEVLDYQRGDDVIQAGRMSLAQWGRLLVRLARGTLMPARRSATRGSVRPGAELAPVPAVRS
jgi:hypothetical protein